MCIYLSSAGSENILTFVSPFFMSKFIQECFPMNIHVQSNIFTFILYIISPHNYLVMFLWVYFLSTFQLYLVSSSVPPSFLFQASSFSVFPKHLITNTFSHFLIILLLLHFPFTPSTLLVFTGSHVKYSLYFLSLFYQNKFFLVSCTLVQNLLLHYDRE